MIVVDSSVWIDYFNGKVTPCTERLDALLGRQLLCLGDLILTEVLQGFVHDRAYHQAKAILQKFPILPMLGTEQVIFSAHCYRQLRKLGFTIRKTPDVIIASFCLSQGHALLSADRDFQPFVEHMGLELLC